MNQSVCAAPAAIKKDSPLTLAQAIGLLREEHTRINKEMAALPAAQWLEPHGQQLANREQELHTTLNVLQRLQ